MLKQRLSSTREAVVDQLVKYPICTSIRSCRFLSTTAGYLGTPPGELTIMRRSKDAKSQVVQSLSWTVEGIFALLAKRRRVSLDLETAVLSSASFIPQVMSKLMISRIEPNAGNAPH